MIGRGGSPAPPAPGASPTLPPGPLPPSRLPPLRIPVPPRRSSHGGPGPEPTPAVSTCSCTREAVIQPRDDHPGGRGLSKRAMPDIGKRAMLGSLRALQSSSIKTRLSVCLHRTFLVTINKSLSHLTRFTRSVDTRSQKPPPNIFHFKIFFVTLHLQRHKQHPRCVSPSSPSSPPPSPALPSAVSPSPTRAPPKGNTGLTTPAAVQQRSLITEIGNIIGKITEGLNVAEVEGSLQPLLGDALPKVRSTPSPTP